MSSATSTKGAEAPVGPYNTADGPATVPNPGLQPWQFFVLAALACATAALFLVRGQGVVTLVMLIVLMGVTALVGMAVLRTVRPLVSPVDDRTSMIGQRTRAALEREKMLALRTIKELEFDRAMGKLSDSDWQEMAGRLRARAARLMRQLDAGAGYRERIQRELENRLGQTAGSRKTVQAIPDAGAAVSVADETVDTVDQESEVETTAHQCSNCQTINDPDARFCKGCGSKL